MSGLFRYPVKSMGGEMHDALEVTAGGVLGDRAYALVDAQTGRVVSAKRPKRWAGILDFDATFVDEPAADAPVPPVRVTFPDGTALETSDGDALAARASDAFGRPVRLESVSPEGAAFEYHWPDMDGLEWKGRPVRDEITVHDIPPGTFFDSSAVVLQSTSGLERLRELQPESGIDARRFRPNLIVDTGDASGFVENEWVGRTLRIGDHVRLAITGPCMRCVMVNLAQGELEADPGILKAAFRHNDGNLGVKASVLEAGRVARGDVVALV